MCWTKTCTYITCAHRRATKQHCQNYLSKPRKTCEKLHFNNTLLALCPKCSRTPTQPAPAPPPVFNQRLRLESLQLGEASSSADHGSNGTELSVRKKAFGRLQKMLGGMRRNRRRSDNDNQSDTGSSQTLVAAPMETEGSVRSSEWFAKEYRGIIGRHPRSTFRQAEAAVVPKVEDIETCTTWSRFLPRQDAVVQEEHEESSKCKTNEGQSGQNRPAAIALGWDEGSRRTEMIQEIPDNSTPDPICKEELRKAEERIARVRDGRGAMHFSWRIESLCTMPSVPP